MAAYFIYITAMRMGLKTNVVSVINIIILSDFEWMLLITVAPSSWRMNTHPVSYTHLTLPTNREV